MTIFEYILLKQPLVIKELYRKGLLTKAPIERETDTEIINWAELMQHAKYKRVRGAIKQIQGVVIR
ncbi:hypothetical protein [Carboxydothermus pertinax]|uniref:Uncharacterized protein n=1 Tax=Carboxydothermus pertinax TaxID=870242 RepID=A0A1L8CRR6_9THEO|nr:hypothetical protein [Carboxydothermus pertinax]GAV21593.1 hypothetical protein cpu_01030 [Carboxydothermus pertinax]